MPVQENKELVRLYATLMAKGDTGAAREILTTTTWTTTSPGSGRVVGTS